MSATGGMPKKLGIGVRFTTGTADETTTAAEENGRPWPSLIKGDVYKTKEFQMAKNPASLARKNLAIQTEN